MADRHVTGSLLVDYAKHIRAEADCVLNLI